MQTGKIIPNNYLIPLSTVSSGTNPFVFKTSHVLVTGNSTLANLTLDGGQTAGAIAWFYGSGGAILSTNSNIVITGTDFTCDNANKHICLFYDGTYWREAYRTNLNGFAGDAGLSPSGSQGPQGDSGNPGPQGTVNATQGPQGSQGDTGPVGSPGGDGDPGYPGVQGTQGATGDVGGPPP